MNHRSNTKESIDKEGNLEVIAKIIKVRINVKTSNVRWELALEVFVTADRPLVSGGDRSSGALYFLGAITGIPFLYLPGKTPAL